MREIKFRGKDVKTGEWIYGDLQHNEIGDTWISRLDCSGNQEGDFINVDFKTVGQFTELKDKSGVDIYEGDLLRFCNNMNGDLEVIFKNEYRGGWNLSHPTTPELLSLGARRKEDLEIIGNIHEVSNES